MMKILSVGEVLWDVFEAKEHLGGAAFNFAAHANVLGHSVSFISAVGIDRRGRRVVEKMKTMGLDTRFIHQVPDIPTGFVTVHLDPYGQPRFTIHRPAAYDFPALSDHSLAEISSLPPDWIYYGTLFQMSPQAKALTLKLIESNPQARRFYDVNLRENCYSADLLEELMSLATAVKLNEEEAGRIQTMLGWSYPSRREFCDGAARQFGWEAVCITRGEAGCALWLNGVYVEADGYRVRVEDTVGSGDAFAAAFLHGLANSWPAAQVADFANRVGALIASRPGGTPSWHVAEAEALPRPSASL